MFEKEEELEKKILALKKDISGQIATIDKILDEMGYGRSVSNKDELIARQDELCNIHKDGRDLEVEIEKSKKKLITIEHLEDEIDKIELYTFQSVRIETLKDEINRLQEERERSLKSIEEKIQELDKRVQSLR